MSHSRKNEKSPIYQIKIKETLDESWVDWFSDMTLSIETSEEGQPITVLTGPVVDQAALNGLLNKIWNFKLTVISVEQV